MVVEKANKEHVEAVFNHTVYIRPEGGSFVSVKSKYLALDHIIVKSENNFEVNQVCDVEITMLNTVSAQPIKVKAKVVAKGSSELRLDYLDISEHSITRLDKIILHFTKNPIEFEEEIESHNKLRANSAKQKIA
jgi:hypothetical protein